MPCKPWNIVSVPLLLVCALTVACTADVLKKNKSLAVGDKAPEFVLKDLDGKEVSLADQLKLGPTVVVVLRGYPGYQCPICNQQFGDLINKSKEFEEAKTTVLFIYPGPAADLDKYAKEFVGGETFPKNYRFLVDPDYKFTNLFNLRWNAPQETAYPASFVVDQKDVIQFAKVSQSHGDRASSAELLEALAKLGK